MKLKLDFEVEPFSPAISINDKIILLGSCFSENIGRELEENKFASLTNPFGVIYNPYSTFRLIELSVLESQEVSVIQNGDVFYDWDSHSQISAIQHDDLIEKVLSTRRALKEWIQESKWIILTPGTSRIYELISNQHIVANCHKIPQKEFHQRLLSVEDIIGQYQKVAKLVSKINPDLQWIFTISPVRHIRDGLIENNHSKAVLIKAIHEIVSSSENCHYFPSYEIVLDELRDYRFYEDDFIHPNNLATHYIWEKFTNATMDAETQKFLVKWAKIKKALGHRPFNASTPSHQKFLKETISQLEQLSNVTNVKPELYYLQSQIHEINS